MGTQKIIQLVIIIVSMFSFLTIYVCVLYYSKKESELFYKKNKDDFVDGGYNPTRAIINREYSKLYKKNK